MIYALLVFLNFSSFSTFDVDFQMGKDYKYGGGYRPYGYAPAPAAPSMEITINQVNSIESQTSTTICCRIKGHQHRPYLDMVMLLLHLSHVVPLLRQHLHRHRQSIVFPINQDSIQCGSIVFQEGKIGECSDCALLNLC